MEHKDEAMQASENSGSKTERSAETAAGNEIVPEEAIGASKRATAKGSRFGHVAAGTLLNLDTPKALEQLAKVFGYALIAAVPNVLFAIATSYFPFTRWTTEIGVPTIDNTAYAAWHLTLFAGSTAFYVAFNCASFDPGDSDNRAMGWHSFFPCLVSCWIAMDVFCFLTFCLPAHMVMESRMYFTEIGMVVIALPIAIGTAAAYLQYRVADKVDSESSSNQDAGKTADSTSDQGSGFWRAASTYISVLLGLTIIMAYPAIIMPLFRAAQTTDFLRLVITCVVHPLAHEFVAMGYRASRFSDSKLQKYLKDKKRGHYLLSSLMIPSGIDAIFIHYRRSMLGVIVDPTAVVLALVITGLEEAFMRCTIVHRDNFMRWLLGKKDPTLEEQEMEREIWSLSSAISMYHEINSIIVSRVQFLVFRPHRYIFNFGYHLGADMTSAGFILISLLLELGFECVVDFMAIKVEGGYGIDLDRFWALWRMNPAAFGGSFITQGCLAMSLSLPAMATVPTIIFCKSIDPCSCLGGGFYLYDTLCQARDGLGNSLNGTASSSQNVSASTNITVLEHEYGSTFSFLGKDSMAVVVSALVLIIITAVFALAQSKIMNVRADTAREEAEKRKIEAEAKNAKLQNQLMLTKLNENQVAMVKNNASIIDGKVPAHFKLHWRVLKFLGRLGSGSFGDCYKGTKDGRLVAIKRMRSGLVDDQVFKAFCKEVVVLATVDHVNIVAFRGYCIDPFLLIVMDFVSGGTLAEFVAAQDPLDPPSMKVVMGIFTGSATGLAYLHAKEPMPTLHRDIKSENILLTEDFEPRIADLGEARAMAEDHAMTMVGTPGYTAPEVLRGEHYGTSADVFSFAIVMSELLALRAPYSDLMKNEDGDSILSMDQITAMTMKREGGVRPSLPDDLDVGMLSLVRRCWSNDASARPSFSSILVHLDEIANAHVTRKREGHKPADDELIRDGAGALCHKLSDLLSHFKPAEWSEKEARSVVDADTFVTAKDVTLKEVLRLEKGPDCIKALGWVMFGGLENGVEITREPLVYEEDIIVNLEKMSALVYIRFTAKVKKEGQEEIKDDGDAFDGLARALRGAEHAVNAEEEVKLATVVTGASAAERDRLKLKPKPKRKLKLKKKKKKEKAAMSKTDRQLMRFIKATRYVRGAGASKIHPSAKLRLFGLRMQAQHGDATPNSIPAALAAIPDSLSKEDEERGAGALMNRNSNAGCALALQKLKLQAWSALKGKSREVAMSEYLDFLGSIAPQWRVAHVLGSHESMQDDKPRIMMWVLHVSFRQLREEEARMAKEGPAGRVLSTSTNRAGAHFRVTSIDILQSSNDSGARNFSEENIADEKPTRVAVSSKESGQTEVEEGDSFYANVPEDLAISDLIIDKGKFKSIEEQREYFEKEMLELANDKEGWTLFAKTNAEVDDSDQLDIYAKTVDWSPVRCLRTSVKERHVGPVEVMAFWQHLHEVVAKDPRYALDYHKSSRQAQKAARKVFRPFTYMTETVISWIQYRLVELPWPITSRFGFVANEYVLKREDDESRSWLFAYNHDIEHPYFTQRKGFLRLRVRKQGLVILPKMMGNENSPIYEYVWLANMDFGGMVPSTLSHHLFRSFMFYPAELLLNIARKKAREAQAEGVDALSSTSLLEDGDVAATVKVDAQVGEGSNGDHTDLKAVVRRLRKELRGKDERLKDKEEKLREKDERLKEKDEKLREKDESLKEKDESLKEKDEEIARLKIELQGMVKKDNEKV